MKFGSPLALPAQGQFTPGQVDGLGSFVGSGLTSFQTTINTINAYSEIVVRLPTPGNPIVYGATLQDQNSPTGAQAIYSASAGYTPGGGGTYDQVIRIPCNNSPGDTMTLTIICAAALNASQAISVYGVTGPRMSLVRQDGRAYPLSRYAVSTFLIAAGTNTLAAAPGANARILVANFSLSGTGSGAGLGAQINATIVGTTGGIVEITQAGTPTLASEAGILCDVNTAVTLNQSGAGASTGAITYDIVPA